MVKLADTIDLGSIANGVQVQVLLPAPQKWQYLEAIERYCNSSALYINGQTAESKKQLSYLEATKGIDELLYDVQDTMPEDAVSTTETDMIYFTTHNISDFITANSISIYLDKIISDENCVLYSRNGDINISGSEINYNGIIYAPNGIVTISANDVCISGTIIAKKVIVYGNDVTFK